MVSDRQEANGKVRRRVVCPHDCPDTCSIIAHVSDGRLVAVSGDPDHPTTRGFLCAKVQHYVDKVYSPDRVLTPLKRVGAKGEGRFAPLSWDKALDIVASRLNEIAVSSGSDSILPYSYYGTMGILSAESMDRRFFNRLGAARLERTICSAAGRAGYDFTIGAALGTDPETTIHARLIIVWGGNTTTSNVHQVPIFLEAKRRGAMLVVIDPRRTRTAELADRFLQINPGTDGALALALMHTIVLENLHDVDFVANSTIGFEELVRRVEHYPPEKVADTVGLEAKSIRDLARLYARTHPSFIRIGMGLQRHSNGGVAVRTIACLPALVGAWRHLGGGALYSNSGAFPFDVQALERPDLVPGAPRIVNMNQIGEALLDRHRPIKALYVYNSNPAAIAPSQQKVLAGLSRNDLFTVVHEMHMTDTTAYADIVLPAPSQFEQTDLFRSYWHLYLQLSEPAIPPLGQARTNFAVLRELARRMGFAEPCFQDTEDDVLRQAIASGHPFFAGITLERLRREGWVRVNVPPAPFADGVFPTPSGRVELRSQRMAELGLDPLPNYVPPAESRQASPELHARYPLTLITPAAQHFLNSTFANLPTLIEAEKRPTVEISAEDAAARGIADGNLVRVWNDRGQFWAYADVGDRVRPGVVCSTSVWWNKHSPAGTNSNQTTPDRLSDLGRGATFFTNLVQVERA